MMKKSRERSRRLFAGDVQWNSSSSRAMAGAAPAPSTASAKARAVASIRLQTGKLWFFNLHDHSTVLSPAAAPATLGGLMRGLFAR